MNPAKDLVRQMLTPDPRQRISAEKILAHPWLAENPENVLKIAEKLRKYNARRKLKVEVSNSRKLATLCLLLQVSVINIVPNCSLS